MKVAGKGPRSGITSGEDNEIMIGILDLVDK